MSPFELFFKNLSGNCRDFFQYHDRYLTIAFILALLPLPFLGFMALAIALFGAIFQIQGKFTHNESLYIALILILSSLNIFFTSILFIFIYTEVLSHLESIKDFILGSLNYLLGRANPFI